MKCQTLFSGKNKKNISICCLLKNLQRWLSLSPLDFKSHKNKFYDMLFYYYSIRIWHFKSSLKTIWIKYEVILENNNGNHLSVNPTWRWQILYFFNTCTLGKIFSRLTVWNTFLTLHREQNSTFHANCLQWQFAWKNQSLFSGKNKTISIFRQLNLPREWFTNIKETF